MAVLREELTRPSPERRSRLRAALALGAVVVAALLVRYGPYERIFRPDGVLLAADGDTYYHALRAERLARQWPHVPWRDPGMNFPYGADVPWPPLLDEIVATIALATGPASPDHVAAVAALVPPIFGAAVVALTAALGAVLVGGAIWWDAALLVALLPAAIRPSFVGRADHHVLEVMISLVAFLAYASALRQERTGWRRPTILGVALALGFWNWSGSALYLLVLCAHVGLLHLALPRGDAPARAATVLARGALVAAVLLAVSIAAVGPPGALASGKLTPITGLAVALCTVNAAGAAIVAAARRRSPGANLPRRLGHLALACAPVLLLPAIPTLRDGIRHGLTAVGASSAWYATIAEFWPLVFSGRQPWTRELLLALFGFGLTPVAAALAIVPFARAWRREPDRRPALAFLAVWSIGMCLLAVVRRRFEGYAIVPVAICAAWAIRAGVAGIRRRYSAWRWAAPISWAALLLAVAAPGFPVALSGAVAEPPAGAFDKDPLLRWLATVRPLPGREGVLSSWSDGHEIQWFARRPVVSTPFGTDIDPRSLADQAAFYVTMDPDAASQLLRERRIGFLLVDSPIREIATMAPFLPGAPIWAIEERGISTGSTYALREELFDLVVSRLFFFDGDSRGRDAPALGEYRLLAESDTPVEILGHPSQSFKLFGVVEGGRLQIRGARAGEVVTASARIRTTSGREFSWTTRTRADDAGNAALRVPYATGLNGTVLAGPYTVGGERNREVTLSERDVLAGAQITVELAR